MVTFGFSRKPMMRVTIDTNALYTSRAGVARYVRGLQQGLMELSPGDIEIFDLAWRVENFGYKQPTRALKTFYRELIWAPFVAPSLLRKNRADILHSLAGPFIQPPNSIRSVVTLHDVAVLRFPHRFRAWHRRSATHRLQNLHRADRIICVSQFTADEALKLVGLRPEKLVVIHNGINPIPEKSGNDPKPDLPLEFFLFVGSLEPGKNLALLKDVYALAHQRGRHIPPLVIIGARWQGVAGEGAPPKDWIYLGQQPDTVLIDAYCRAKALLFPSIYEGFGFPVIEAQAAGCPVICSPVASLPEIAGKGALLADLQPGEYLNAISRLENEPGLRDNLVGEGKRNASRFDWRKCAMETSSVYNAV
jgi:glycosyltransferase involved in cell wall biosynthesis